MEVLRLWLGAELRRRWRAHVALALLIGVVGSVLLTVAAGARTTATAYDRFVNRQAIPTVEFDSLEPGAVEALRSLPAVEAAGAYAPMFAAPKREGVLAGQDFIVFAAADRQYGRTVDRPIVLRGRLPRADAVDEVAVNAAMTGCLPEHLPYVIAGVEAICKPEYNLYGVGATTGSAFQMLLVNGPSRDRVGIDYSYGCMGGATGFASGTSSSLCPSDSVGPQTPIRPLC